jgi:hypothetical protein
MTEPMAIEKLVAERYELDGYFTLLRVPFKLKSGSSDLDVIAYDKKTKDTIIIECKAWGSPDDYSNFDTTARRRKIKWLFKDLKNRAEKFRQSETNVWGIGKPKKLVIVIPGFFDDKEVFENDVSHALKCKVELLPIHELIKELIEKVQTDKDIRRKRYGSTSLEFIRWLIRSYDEGHFNFTDMDLILQRKREESKEVYQKLAKNYVRNVIRYVKKHDKGIHTRENTLRTLLRLKDPSTIPEIVEKGKQMDFELDYNRVSVGLGTWLQLGIVIETNGKYQVNPNFYELIKGELK